MLKGKGEIEVLAWYCRGDEVSGTKPVLKL